MTIRKAFDVYLTLKEVSLKPNSVEAYRVRVNGFLDYLGKRAEKPLSTLKTKVILDYLRSSPLNSKTLQLFANVIRGFVKYWKGEGKLDLNLYLLKAPKIDQKVPICVTEEDMKKFDRVLDPNEFQDLKKLLIIHLLWSTGMRVNELLTLDIDDIGDKNFVRITTEKSRKLRIILWSNRAQELLEQYLPVRRQICKKSPALFVSYNIGAQSYKRTSSRTLQRWVKELVERAQIDRKITPHSFRHGKAHMMLTRQGASLHDVKEVLGHSSIITTQMYTVYNLKESIALAERFNPDAGILQYVENKLHRKVDKLYSQAETQIRSIND